MRDGLDDILLERTWTHTVMPYIEEQFFDEPSLASEFELERLKAEMSGTPTGLTPDEGGGDEVDGGPAEADPAEGMAP
jgi:hypothetical protein